jgi:hypothetical protein
MPGLNVHADSDNSYATTKKKWNRGPKVILAVSLLLLIPVVGTSLASKVTVNSNGITFGQGYAAALACSDTVTITPHSEFNYATAAPSSSGWQVTTLTLSGIDTSDFSPYSLLGCGGKRITLQAMIGGINALPFDITFVLPLTTSVPDQITGGNFDYYTVANSDPAQSGGSAHAVGDSLVITLITPVDATSIDGFTIQES